MLKMNFYEGAKKVMYYPKSHFYEAEKLSTVFLISKLNPPAPQNFSSPIAKSTIPRLLGMTLISLYTVNESSFICVIDFFVWPFGPLYGACMFM